MNERDLATSKQLAYAQRIEDLLHIKMPDSLDRYTISKYISENHKAFLSAEMQQNKMIEARIKDEIKITDIAREMGLTPVRKGHYVSLKEHDSVIIDVDKNCFWRNSKIGRGASIGRGGSVIDFAVEFSNMDAKEVTKDFAARITGNIYRPAPKAQATTIKKEKKELFLPERAPHMRNVFAYLTKSRYIDPNIVQDMVNRRMLYQDKTFNNCVFVSYDDSKNAAFACVRGTNTYKRFLRDLEGCNYEHCFFVRNNSKALVVTESPIETMSYMSLLKEKGIDYTQYDYLGLAGTGKYAAAQNHDSKYHYDKIILGTNNDEPGKDANKALHDVLKDSKAVIIDEFPHQNDWNDELKYVIDHGLRPDYLSLNQDQKDAIEARLDAVMMANDDHLKFGSMEFTSGIMQEANLPDMDLYIQDYAEYVHAEYPDTDLSGILKQERAKGKEPINDIIKNYNHKSLKHRPPSIEKNNGIQMDYGISL